MWEVKIAKNQLLLHIHCDAYGKWSNRSLLHDLLIMELEMLKLNLVMCTINVYKN